jgi:predicted RecB family endonuclease
MYPYTSYTAAYALYEEKLIQAEPVLLERPAHPVARSLARALGHAFVALGNQLVQLGR